MCREKALAMCLLDAVASAANMRSGLTETFVHNHSGPWTSAPCLTLTGTSGAGFAPVTVFTPPPSCLPSPRCGFAFPTSRGFSPPRYYEDSDSCTAHLPCRSPRLLRHTLAAVPSPTTWTAWTSLLPPRQRLQRFSDFALHEQAHRSSPPNRVRSPTDQQFASGCSPPRLTATRLPSATELWLPPTRTFTVLMWRPHGRTHAGVDSRHPGSQGCFRRHPCQPGFQHSMAGMTQSSTCLNSTEDTPPVFKENHCRNFQIRTQRP